MKILAEQIDRARAFFARAYGEGRANPWFARGLILAALVIVTDQLTKYFILGLFEVPQFGLLTCEGVSRQTELCLQHRRASVDLLPFFKFTLVGNTGVSFGLLAGTGARVLLGVFSFVVALGLVAWLAFLRRPWFALAVGGVIGGAVGNLFDRVTRGAVVDFLDFSELYFPWVFNIADSAISVGMAAILIDSLFFADKGEDAPAGGGSDGPSKL